MPSAKEMRDELRELRKTHPDHMPVSKMKKADISSMIERLKTHTEITPAVALMKADPKPAKGEVESLAKAKKGETAMKVPAKAPVKTKSVEKKELPKEAPKTDKMAHVRAAKAAKKAEKKD